MARFLDRVLEWLGQDPYVDDQDEPPVPMSPRQYQHWKSGRGAVERHERLIRVPPSVRPLAELRPWEVALGTANLPRPGESPFDTLSRNLFRLPVRPSVILDLINYPSYWIGGYQRSLARNRVLGEMPLDPFSDPLGRLETRVNPQTGQREVKVPAWFIHPFPLARLFDPLVASEVGYRGQPKAAGDDLWLTEEEYRRRYQEFVQAARASELPAGEIVYTRPDGTQHTLKQLAIWGLHDPMTYIGTATAVTARGLNLTARALLTRAVTVSSPRAAVAMARAAELVARLERAVWAVWYGNEVMNRVMSYPVTFVLRHARALLGRALPHIPLLRRLAELSEQGRIARELREVQHALGVLARAGFDMDVVVNPTPSSGEVTEFRITFRNDDPARRGLTEEQVQDAVNNIAEVFKDKGWVEGYGVEQVKGGTVLRIEVRGPYVKQVRDALSNLFGPPPPPTTAPPFPSSPIPGGTPSLSGVAPSQTDAGQLLLPGTVLGPRTERGQLLFRELTGAVQPTLPGFAAPAVVGATTEVAPPPPVPRTVPEGQLPLPGFEGGRQLPLRLVERPDGPWVQTELELLSARPSRRGEAEEVTEAAVREAQPGPPEGAQAEELAPPAAQAEEPAPRAGEAEEPAPHRGEAEERPEEVAPPQAEEEQPRPEAEAEEPAPWEVQDQPAEVQEGERPVAFGLALDPRPRLQAVVPRKEDPEFWLYAHLDKIAPKYDRDLFTLEGTKLPKPLWAGIEHNIESPFRPIQRGQHGVYLERMVPMFATPDPVDLEDKVRVALRNRNLPFTEDEVLNRVALAREVGAVREWEETIWPLTEEVRRLDDLWIKANLPKGAKVARPTELSVHPWPYRLPEQPSPVTVQLMYHDPTSVLAWRVGVEQNRGLEIGGEFTGTMVGHVYFFPVQLDRTHPLVRQATELVRGGQSGDWVAIVVVRLYMMGGTVPVPDTARAVKPFYGYYHRAIFHRPEDAALAAARDFFEELTEYKLESLLQVRNDLLWAFRYSRLVSRRSVLDAFRNAMTKEDREAARELLKRSLVAVRTALRRLRDRDPVVMGAKWSPETKKLLDEGVLPDPDEWYLVLGEEDLVNMGLGDLPPEEEEYFKQIGNIVHHAALHADMHPQRGTWQYRVEHFLGPVPTGVRPGSLKRRSRFEPVRRGVLKELALRPSIWENQDVLQQLQRAEQDIAFHSKFRAGPEVPEVNYQVYTSGRLTAEDFLRDRAEVSPEDLQLLKGEPNLADPAWLDLAYARDLGERIGRAAQRLVGEGDPSEVIALLERLGYQVERPGWFFPLVRVRIGPQVQVLGPGVSARPDVQAELLVNLLVRTGSVPDVVLRELERGINQAARSFRARLLSDEPGAAGFRKVSSLLESVVSRVRVGNRSAHLGQVAAFLSSMGEQLSPSVVVQVLERLLGPTKRYQFRVVPGREIVAEYTGGDPRVTVWLLSFQGQFDGIVIQGRFDRQVAGQLPDRVEVTLRSWDGDSLLTFLHLLNRSGLNESERVGRYVLAPDRMLADSRRHLVEFADRMGLRLREGEAVARVREAAPPVAEEADELDLVASAAMEEETPIPPARRGELVPVSPGEARVVEELPRPWREEREEASPLSLATSPVADVLRGTEPVKVDPGTIRTAFTRLYGPDVDPVRVVVRLALGDPVPLVDAVLRVGGTVRLTPRGLVLDHAGKLVPLSRFADVDWTPEGALSLLLPGLSPAEGHALIQAAADELERLARQPVKGWEWDVDDPWKLARIAATYRAHVTRMPARVGVAIPAHEAPPPEVAARFSNRMAEALARLSRGEFPDQPDLFDLAAAVRLAEERDPAPLVAVVRRFAPIQAVDLEHGAVLLDQLPDQPWRTVLREAGKTPLDLLELSGQRERAEFKRLVDYTVRSLKERGSLEAFLLSEQELTEVAREAVSDLLDQFELVRPQVLAVERALSELVASYIARRDELVSKLARAQQRLDRAEFSPSVREVLSRVDPGFRMLVDELDRVTREAQRALRRGDGEAYATASVVRDRLRQRVEDLRSQVSGQEWEPYLDQVQRLRDQVDSLERQLSELPLRMFPHVPLSPGEDPLVALTRYADQVRQAVTDVLWSPSDPNLERARELLAPLVGSSVADELARNLRGPGRGRLTVPLDIEGLLEYLFGPELDRLPSVWWAVRATPRRLVTLSPSPAQLDAVPELARHEVSLRWPDLSWDGKVPHRVPLQERLGEVPPLIRNLIQVLEAKQRVVLRLARASVQQATEGEASRGTLTSEAVRLIGNNLSRAIDRAYDLVEALVPAKAPEAVHAPTGGDLARAVARFQDGDPVLLVRFLAERLGLNQRFFAVSDEGLKVLTPDGTTVEFRHEMPLFEQVRQVQVLAAAWGRQTWVSDIRALTARFLAEVGELTAPQPTVGLAERAQARSALAETVLTGRELDQYLRQAAVYRWVVELGDLVRTALTPIGVLDEEALVRAGVDLSNPDLAELVRAPGSGSYGKPVYGVGSQVEFAVEFPGAERPFTLEFPPDAVVFIGREAPDLARVLRPERRVSPGAEPAVPRSVPRYRIVLTEEQVSRAVDGLLQELRQWYQDELVGAAEPVLLDQAGLRRELPQVQEEALRRTRERFASFLQEVCSG